MRFETRFDFLWIKLNRFHWNVKWGELSYESSTRIHFNQLFLVLFIWRNVFTNYAFPKYPERPLKLSKCSINLIHIVFKIVQQSCYVAWHSIAYGETAIIFPIRHCLSFAYTCVFAQYVAMLLAATMLHCVNKNSISCLSLSFSFTACLAHISIYIRRKKIVALLHLFRFHIFSLFRSAVVWRVQILCVRCTLQ